MNEKHRVNQIKHLIILRDLLIKPLLTAQDYGLKEQEKEIGKLIQSVLQEVKDLGIEEPASLNLVYIQGQMPRFLSGSGATVVLSP